MTTEQEEMARAKAFYLLKKWSSVTFLRCATDFYRTFLSRYERGLAVPSPNQNILEERYRSGFLRRLIEMDSGLEALSTGVDRDAAYRLMVEGGKFSDYIWGMAAEHWGVEHDPFFNKMGRGGIRDENGRVFTLADSGFVEDCAITLICVRAMSCTVNFKFMQELSHGKRANGGKRVFTHWTFESLFEGAWDGGGWRSHWPPAHNFPAQLQPCPSRNESNVGQIYSGEEVDVDGIYEPWYLTAEVGCPNYLLKGSTAHKYQREGTNDSETVRWRLIWQDDRYLDGKDVPIEEADYAELSRPKLPVPASAYAEEPCPQTGRYTAPRLGHRKADVQRGQPMPGPVYTNTGAVVWYLEDDKRAGSPREDGDGQAE